MEIFSKLKNWTTPHLNKLDFSNKDWVFLSVILCITLLTAIGPFAVGSLTSSPTRIFTGAAQQAAGDYMIYMNLIEQARRGAFLFESFFTSEPHTGLYFSPFWMINGKIAALFSISSSAIYEISKVFWGAIAVIAIFALSRRIFEKPIHSYIATSVVLFGGGVSLFIGPYLNYIIELVPENQGKFYPLDLYVSEAFGSMLIGHSGLFSLALILMLSILWLFISKKESTLRSFALIFLPFILSIVHSYDVITLGATFSLFTAYLYLSKRNFLPYLKKLAFIIIGSGPGIIYMLLLFSYDTVIRGWVTQNVVEMPYLFPTLIGLGLLLPLAIFASYKAFKTKNTILILLTFWAGSALVLAISPLSFQRKLLHGLSFPLGILASSTLFYIFSATHGIKITAKKYAFQGLIIFSVIIFIFLSRAYNIVYENYYYTTGEFPYFLSQEQHEAYTYITVRTGTDDIILAQPPHSQLIPGLYHRKNYFSDKHQTIEYERKRQEFIEFTQRWNNIDWKKEFLTKNNISYFLYDKTLYLPNDIDFYTLPFLERVFENDEMVVYKVI